MSLLYGIIPFFDFSNSFYRKQNLKRFISNYKNQDKLKLVLVEAIYDKDKELEDFSKDIFLHLKINVNQKLWYKENLINIVIEKYLPSDWQNVCWIDSDIDFLNNNWIEYSIEYLKNFNFIQLFSTAIVLDKKGEILSQNNTPIVYKRWLSFSKDFKWNLIDTNKFQVNNFTKNNLLNNPYLKPHTGFGWGTNKDFFFKIKKIWDQNIIGGADHVIAKCVTQNIEEYPFKEFYSEKYKLDLMSYYNNFKNCLYKPIPGTIIHYWHGKYTSRQYMDRHQILKNHNFELQDINYKENGIIQVHSKSNLLSDLENYFNSRELIE